MAYVKCTGGVGNRCKYGTYATSSGSTSTITLGWNKDPDVILWASTGSYFTYWRRSFDTEKCFYGGSSTNLTAYNYTDTTENSPNRIYLKSASYVTFGKASSNVTCYYFIATEI